jgi:iron complex transport system substrate-binding protein
VPRIVSTVPAATLNLVLIGAADRLAGVSTFDRDYLPAAQANLPIIGDYQTINYEQLVTLKPTALVIQQLPARVSPRLREFTAEHHIELLNMKFDHVSDIWDSVRILARAARRVEEGENAIAAAQADLMELTAKFQNLPHPRVIYLTDPQTLAAGNTFIDEMITIAGGDNAGRGAGDGFLEINNEVIAELAPDVLLIGAPGQRPAMKDDPRLATWLRLPIPAARNNRVHLVTDPRALDASVDIGKHIRDLAELIHAGN